MKKLSAATVFAKKLIIKKSVTPNDDGAIKVLKDKLSEMGFSNIDLPFGSKKNSAFFVIMCCVCLFDFGLIHFTKTLYP